MDLGRFREAIAGFSESLRLKPDNHLALFSLGECHLKLGEAREIGRVNVLGVLDAEAAVGGAVRLRDLLEQVQDVAVGLVADGVDREL